MKTAPQIACGSLVFFCAAILLPGSAAAQQQPISVSPTSVSVQATVGTNAPSQTVQVKKRGKPTTQVSWSVVLQNTSSWLSVSPTSGVNDGTLTLTFNTVALAAATYQTSFGVQATGSSPLTVNVQATIVGSAPPPLVANCPANKTASSPNGQPVPVTYDIPTPSGGTLPYTLISGSPQSGSNFPVGTTPVTVTVQDSSQPQQTDTCTFTVTVTDDSSPPPPPSTGVGPQSTITCPTTGAVNIFPGSSIQSFVNANPGTTTFCLKSGVHYVTSSVTPKTGNTFIGEYISETNKAILDGTGWTTTDDTQAAFRVYDNPNDPNDPSGPIDSVTIRNLVIRNMPYYGIHGSDTRSAASWTIEFNEIASNKFGVLFARNTTIRNNYIHHNVVPGERSGGYLGIHADNAIVDSNEIASNGPEQKVALSTNVTFRNNFVHHNVRDGIWYDFNLNAAALIDRNRVEDNGGNGIIFEASNGATITNNTMRRNGEDGVLISVSQRVQISNNLLEANFGGIEYFVNCGGVSGQYDLQDNAAYDNTVVVGTRSFTFAVGFNNLSQCTSTELAPYLNGDKNLTFSRNTYHVPSLSFTRYFLWGNGFTGVYKDWNQWQALGSTMSPPKSLQDVGGSIISP